MSPVAVLPGAMSPTGSKPLTASQVIGQGYKMPDQAR